MYTGIASLLLAGLLAATGVAALPAASSPRAVTARSAGDELFGKADFAGAEADYALALRSDPHNAGAELGLARIALYRNRLDEAERHARAFAVDASDDPRAGALLSSITERRDEGSDYRVAIAGAEVDVPLVRTDPLPEIEAVIDGKRANLLIDTGGPGLDLSASFVKELGVATEPAGEALFAGGLRGVLRMGHIDRLDLGGASIRSIPIHVPPELPPGIDGVIGTGILYRFLTTIDYPNRRLVLRKKTASQTFEAGARARGAVIVPMLLVPDHFIFATGRIDKAPEALFNVDTGGAGIGVDATRAELTSAGIVPNASHPSFLSTGGGMIATLPFTADVTIGRRTFRKVPGVYLPDGARTRMFPFAVAGTMSQELFKRGALTLDFSAMNLVFVAPPAS